jgi:hypothetical protein
MVYHWIGVSQHQLGYVHLKKTEDLSIPTGIK